MFLTFASQSFNLVFARAIWPTHFRLKKWFGVSNVIIVFATTTHRRRLEIPAAEAKEFGNGALSSGRFLQHFFIINIRFEGSFCSNFWFENIHKNNCWRTHIVSTNMLSRNATSFICSYLWQKRMLQYWLLLHWLEDIWNRYSRY